MPYDNGGIIGRRNRWPSSGVWGLRAPGYPFLAANITSLYSQASASSSSHNFASVPYGAEAFDRDILVGVVIRGAGNITINSVTVSGNAAALVADIRNSTSSNTTRAAIYRLRVPAGSSGTIAISLSASALLAVQVWRMVDAAEGAYDSDTSVSNSPSVSVDVPSRGAVCAVSYSFNTATSTWSGVTQDNLTALTNGQLSAAHAEFSSASPGQTVQCTWSSNNVPALAVAVFGPAS